MKRLTARLVDVARTSGNEVGADDPGQLLQKLQRLIFDEYRDELHDTKNLLITIADTRNPNPNPLQGLFVEADSPQSLLDELDKAIRETYRAELQGDTNGPK